MNDYAWNIHAPSDRDLRPQECPDKKVEEKRPPFFLKSRKNWYESSQYQ